MTYRPIGIAPLRNYGWELSNHLRAPSRQVGRPGKKGTEGYLLWRTSALLYGERRQSKSRFTLVQRESPRAPSIRRSELRDTSAIATNHL